MPKLKYDPKFCDEAEEFLSQPTSPTQHALTHELGIHYQTYRVWQRTYPDFKAAVDAGLKVRDDLINSGLAIPHYTPGICKKVVQLMAAGNSIIGTAAALGISNELLTKWRRANEELEEAVQYGKTLEQANWEKVGLEARDGKRTDFNNTVWRTCMKARFGYGEEVTVKGDKNNPLHTDTTTTIEFVHTTKDSDDETE